MKKKTLQSEWIEYRNRVLPADAGPTQIMETRRAFYAGAQSILTMQWDMSSDMGVSDDDGAAQIEAWHQECRDFAAAVGTLAEHHFP